MQTIRGFRDILPEQIALWQKVEKEDTSNNTQKEETINKEGEIGVGSGGGGGGGGSDTSSKNEDTENSINPEDCTTKTLSYSIINQNKEEECISYNEEICTEKTIKCSATIKNNDVLKGEIEIKLSFFPYNTDKENNSFHIITEEIILEPKRQKTILEETTINSIEEGGIANQNISCSFNTLSPLKSIC